MEQVKLLLRLLIVICFFTTSTFSYASEMSSNEKKGQMNQGSDSTGSQDAVDNKNAVSDAEKEQSEGEGDEKESQDSEQSEDKEKDDKKPAQSSSLSIQASTSEQETIKGWLEELLGRTLNPNNANDKAILNFWTSLVDKGYSLNQIQALIETVGVLKNTIDYYYGGSFYQMGKVDLNDIGDLQALFNWANLINMGFTQLNVKMMVILANVFMQDLKDNMIYRNLDVRNERDIKIIAGWAQYMRQGYSAQQVYSLFKSQMTPKVNTLLGSFDAGFFTYMAEEALSKINGGLDYICDLLGAMVAVRGAVENLIGKVDILNAPYEDNGFLTYWAEQALVLGVPKVNQILYTWKQILPAIERFEGRKLNLFNPDDSGIVSFWAGEVQKLVDGGMGLEPAIAQVIQLILNQGQVILTPTMEALIPYVEPLIGATFDVDNPLHMGFLTYWAERADAEGLQGIKDLLSAMADVLDAVENLIGKVDILNAPYEDNGFLTYWAERALAEGAAKITALLNAMANIRPAVEALIGPIDLFNGDDPGNGFLTYWAERALAEGAAKINQVLYIWGQLIPSIETYEGRALDLFNPDDSGIVSFWAGEVQKLVEGGMGLEPAIAQVIQLILNQGQVILTPTQQALIPYVEPLIGATFDVDNPLHMGFLSYWAERADTEGLQGIKDLLSAMAAVLPAVKNLIGNINLFDENDPGNGFLTYWAERALTESSASIIALLQAIAAILPSVETLIDRPVDLFDGSDPANGFLGYWAERALAEGAAKITALLNAMANIRPAVEALIGPIDLFNGDDPGNGFLTYWAERALAEGAANINALLNAMAAILPSVEALIGEIDFFDTNYEDNGYLSYWAERALTESSASIIALLQAIAAILPSVETLIDRPVDLFDGSDPANGFLGYWAERVIAEGSAKIIALLNAMAGIINEVEALIGPVDFFDTNYEDNGFLTFWAEYALINGLQYTKNVLSNMENILDNDFDNNGKSEIEELIGPVDFFDNNYDDNGFITYWAEQAVAQGVNNVNRGLYIWKRLLPHVEAYEGRSLNLFIGNDAGILSYWMDEVIKLINKGLGLEQAIQEIINRLKRG